MRVGGSDIRLKIDANQKSAGQRELGTKEVNDLKLNHMDNEMFNYQINSGSNWVQDYREREFKFTYDVGDEPEEDDDEMRNLDDDESGEDEDDQDDILIVEGEDDDYEPDTSPEMRKTTKMSECKPRAVSNCATSLQEGGSKGGLTPANKSLNASQEGVSTQLYGGDIYLLGGSHFIMSDNI